MPFAMAVPSIFAAVILTGEVENALLLLDALVDVNEVERRGRLEAERGVELHLWILRGFNFEDE